MKKNWKGRLVALVLAACTLMSLCVTAQASSIGDGSKTCTVAFAPIYNFLTTTAGTSLEAGGFVYTTNDGLTGPAYCVDYGLAHTERALPIVGKYNASPATAGAFASGYPQHSIETFLGLYLEDNNILSGLTESEYRYATQVAVWATLGQLGVDGTAYTSGREYLNPPGGNAQQERVFRTVQLILNATESWDRVYQTGMYIRLEEDVLGGNIAIPGHMTLEFAAKENQYGLKCEVINGKSYYTREYIFASATSTYYSGYNIELWADNAPAGTIFTDTNNVELPRSTFREHGTWALPVTPHYGLGSQINNNGYEYWGRAKLCIPVETAPNSGEITINSGAYVMQYEIYLANNESATEQSFIIADPSKGTQTADAILSWGSRMTETGNLQITKVGGGGEPLEGAEFTLTGSDGSSYTGVTNERGIIIWTGLDPNVLYSLTETKAPAGYAVAESRYLTIKAAQTRFETVKNNALQTLTVHKIDRQNGYSLRGAVFKFEQIDGTYAITATTDHAGLIQMDADKLPIGSYKVYEIAAPEGYELDPTPQIVNWDGKQNVTLTFQNTRKLTLILSKKDSRTGYNLPEATFEVYRDGRLITTVTTNSTGLAYIHDVEAGYYEIKETVAPPGYVLNSRVYGINIDPYDPATTDDPRLVVENDPMPSIRIVKYDRESLSPLRNVVFTVHKDGSFFGSYATDEGGEIILTGLEPGTYTVEENNAGTHVADAPPQQIELKAGQEEPVTLFFFNSLKPGIYIQKVDESTLQPLKDAVFLVRQVDGSYRKELKTDASGEIDLTGLKPGAYTVQETVAPAGYRLDDTIRTFQIEAGQNAEFVFSNSKLPSLTLIKRDADGDPMEGVTFSLTPMGDGAHSDERTTDIKGSITWDELAPGMYSLVEVATKSTHVLDTTEHHILLSPGKDSTVVLVNQERPSLRIVKYDRTSHTPMPNVTFEIFRDTISLGKFQTDEKGEILLSHVDPGTYKAVEVDTGDDSHILTTTPQEVALQAGGGMRELVFFNDLLPGLRLIKVDSADLSTPIPNAKFSFEAVSGNFGPVEYSTGEDGTIDLSKLPTGAYVVTEVECPGYLVDDAQRIIELKANDTAQFIFTNTKLPSLTITKVDSITGNPLQSVKFSVTYASNNTSTGEINDMGVYYTNANGEICIDTLRDGWYKVTELESISGYAIQEPATQEVYIKGGEDKTLIFKNTPLSALVVWKYDSVSGAAIEGAMFQVKYLSGTSGTGGTVIGTYKTSANGSFTVTGLQAGTYICEEIASDGDHVIDTAPQTAYISGEEQSVVQLMFGNSPKASLTVKKVDSVTRSPLSDVEFLVTLADGSLVGDANGKFTTDSTGSFTISGIDPGTTLIVKETRAKDGYILDDAPQTITVKAGQAAFLEFRNQRKGSLVIVKRAEGTNTLLPGATFKITTSSGEAISNNGLYTTDKSGQIVLTGLEPDTYIVSEYKAPEGYELDATPQTVVVNAHNTKTLYFYNTLTPEGNLRIVKLDEQSRQPISGVTFLVTYMDGKRIGTYRTNSQGVIRLNDLTPGWYTVTETKAAEGYKLDAQPHDVQVKDGETATLELTNRQSGSALIHKIDAVTGEGIYGVTFLVSDSRGNPVGQYTSDNQGYVYIDETLTDGKYTIREIQQAEGYILDTTPKTVYIEYGGCSTVVWKNTPIRGQLQVVKRSADYNPINGLPAGTLLEGATFEVYDERTGNKVDTIVSGANGLAVSQQLPLGRYIIREVKAPAHYMVNDTPMTAVLEYSGQIVRFEVTNKSAATGVAIVKAGPKEAVSGQPVRYVFSGIANTGNVPLDSFYWRDTLPAAVTLDKVVTGSYNRPGSYKVVYKVNNTGDYRTLADNLSTAKNYTLDARPATLGLAANERITEIMFVFGQAPAEFAQVETPMLYCTAAKGLGAGSSFTNVADVGGTYNGAWVQAVSRWTTAVYGKPTPLPRTGY